MHRSSLVAAVFFYSRKSLFQTSIIQTRLLSVYNKLLIWQSHAGPLFPTTFTNEKLALAIQMADTECFRARSTGCMTAEDTESSTVRAGFSVKVKVAVKVSCWVLHPQETE